MRDSLQDLLSEGRKVGRGETECVPEEAFRAAVGLFEVGEHVGQHELICLVCVPEVVRLLFSHDEAGAKIVSVVPRQRILVTKEVTENQTSERFAYWLGILGLLLT